MPTPKPITHADIENLFTYHAPKGDQSFRYETIRDAAKYLGQIILANTHQSADQMKAITKLREAVMMANASIALEPDDLVKEGAPHQYPTEGIAGIPSLCHEWGDAVINVPSSSEALTQASRKVLITTLLAAGAACLTHKVESRGVDGDDNNGVMAGMRATPRENHPHPNEAVAYADLVQMFLDEIPYLQKLAANAKNDVQDSPG